MPEKLKALSIRQPWPEQIMRGRKTVENRARPTNIRGRIYIYASLKRNPPEVEAEDENDVGYPIDDLPRGLVIGIVELIDCADSGKGEYRYQWRLARPQRLPKPLKPKMKPQPVWFHPFGAP